MILGVGLALLLSTNASAELILSSLRYDGHVRAGATVGVEKHFSNNPAQLPPPNPGTLPADNSMLPGALLDGNNLNLTITEVLQLSILQISATFGDVFNNDLDATLPYPVQFDATYYSNSLGPGEFVQINEIRYENFDVLPYPIPDSQMISAAGPNFGDPLGSINNPVRVQLGFTEAQLSDFNNGFLKVRISYTTPLVPEPATWALALFAIAGSSTLRRHTRSA
jgi:hypothetical protein